MNAQQIEQTIRQYIPQVINVSLATSVDGRPWATEVQVSYDDQLNFYFRSRPSRRHSQEIAANPHVAGTIVTQHFINQAIRGVYFEVRAELLEGVTENDAAYTTYRDRFGRGVEMVTEAHEEDGHKFYKITVSDFYVFDSYKTIPGQKYHLPWTTRALSR